MTERAGSALGFWLSWARAAHAGVICLCCLAGPLLIAFLHATGLRFALLDVTFLLHLTLALTVAGAPFTLTDPCSEFLSSLPRSFTITRIQRSVATAAAVVGSWILQLLMAPALIRSSEAYPISGLVIEVMPFILLALALSWRDADGRSGAAGMIGLCVLYLACWVVPKGFDLFLEPNDPGFAGSRMRWWLLTGTTAVLLASVMWEASYRRLAALGRRVSS